MTAAGGLRDRVGLVVYRRTGEIDAIDEYSRRLVDALCERGDPALYTSHGMPSARRVDAGFAWILIQYNPFSYGRWGFAPGVVRDALALRRRLDVPLAVMVHESWIETQEWKSALAGAYQRAQLEALSRIATVVLATRQTVARQLGPRTVHVPTGSTITPVATSFETARDRLGLGDDLVVALFGRANPSRALDHAEAAINAIARAQDPHRVRVFNLGADAPSLHADPSIRVLSPGKIGAEELSLHLWASDLMLLPFTDGLSTARTTLMAALAHGLPVLSLRGQATDDILLEREDVVRLTPIGDLDGFGRAAVDIVMDRRHLRTSAQAARTFYLEQFDWPHVARRVMSAIEGVAGSDTRSGRLGRSVA